ncbi:hypothetical protein ACLKA6_000222 [Drosophila palustris]
MPTPTKRKMQAKRRARTRTRPGHGQNAWLATQTYRQSDNRQDMQPAVPLKTSLVLWLSQFVLGSGLWLWTRNTAQRRNKFWTAAPRKSTRMQNPSTQRKDNESLLNLSK